MIPGGRGSVRWFLLLLPLLVLLLPQAAAVPSIPYDLAPQPPGHAPPQDQLTEQPQRRVAVGVSGGR